MSITLVQSLSDKQETADGIPTITLGDAPEDGNLVVTFIVAQQQAGNVTITQPAGYTVPPTYGLVSDSGQVATQMSWKVASGESSTIAGGLSASRVWGIAVFEFNDDLGGTWTYDTGMKATGQSVAPSTGTMPMTAKPDSLLIAGVGVAKGATPSTPTNGFTLEEVQIASSTSGNLIDLAALYRIVAALGTYSTGVKLSTSRHWAANIFAFYVTAPLNVNTVAPVASGTAEVGSELSTTDGTWTGTSPPSSFLYQWQRDNEGGGAYTNIAGATAATYTLDFPDDGCNVRCQVSAINAGGTSPSTPSNALGPVITPAPSNIVPPEIAGAATRTLAVFDGIWSAMNGSVHDFTREWELSADGATGWTPIAGDTDHVIDDTEVGQYVRVAVTATNSGGSTQALTDVFGPLIATSLALTVEMAFGSGPGAVDPDWTDITDYVIKLNWNRGRQNELNQMQAGTGQILLGDFKSDFDPRNPDSVFYPNVRPGTPVRAYLTIGYGTYPLFLMTTERQPRTLRAASGYTERQLDLVDGFAIIANAGVSGATFEHQSSDARFNDVLDYINWPEERRRIGVGASTIIAAVFDEDDGTKAQAHLLQVNDSENGLFFCDGNGDIVLAGRHELIQVAGYTTSKATFTDVPA